MTQTPNVAALVTTLRSKLSDTSIPDEPNFLKQDETLIRFLKARNWDIDSAEKMLRHTIAWRADYHPLNAECDRCRTDPGSHTLRQIGFDDCNRPVIYASFFPAHPSQRNIVVGALAHLIYVFENAVRCMPPGVTQCVFILDCAEMSPKTCYPRLGYEAAQIMSEHYPERLGLAICLRPGAIFKVAWQAMKPFLPSATVSKVNMVSNRSQIQSVLDRHLPSSVSEWVMAEYKSNRSKITRDRYRPFWKRQTETKHDPRGVPEYVSQWIEAKHPSGHVPHPNMLDYLNGKLNSSLTLSENMENGDYLENDDETAELDEDAAKKLMASLPNEYQIPEGAEKWT